jgi:hypothetical protein
MAKRTAKERSLRLLPLAAIAGLVVAFFALGWSRYLSLDLIREHGLNLQAYARARWWTALAAFIAVYALAITARDGFLALAWVGLVAAVIGAAFWFLG